MTQSLLKIDVDREIQKLTRNRFKSSTEWAVALCQYAMGRDCTSLSLQLDARSFELRYRGTSVGITDLERLCVIFDEQQSPDARHRAIVALEEGDSFDLLCAFYLKNAKVTIVSATGSAVVAPRRRPVRRTETGSLKTVIAIRSGKLKRGPLEKALRTACRFSPVPVMLNDKRISSGHKLENCFAQRAFEWRGVRGVVGIPLESDFVRQVTLKHGITVKDSLRQPGFGLLYHTIIDSPKSALSSADLDEVRNVVRSLYMELGKYIEQLESAQRQRALEVLFIRYRETQDVSYVKGVQAFERVDGNRFTVETLRRLASDGPVYGIHRGTSTESWNLAGRQVFYLDARQWNFLEKELGIEITWPSPLSRSGNWRLKKKATNQNGAKKDKPFSKEIRTAAEQLILF